MSDYVSPLLQWLNANPEWAGLATFLISAAESVAIIGTIVPGSITMTAIGALAGAGVIPLWQTIFLAILGAVIGDGISYWIGHYFKDSLRRIWPFRTNPTILSRGETFVMKYGVMSVFIGRFVGPVRALVPLVAGMLGMKPLQFTAANIASAIGWAPAYMLPGILLGAASLELPPDIAIHVMLVLLLIFLFIILCIWMTFKILQLIHLQTSEYLSSIWEYMKKRRRHKPLLYLLKHHDRRRAAYGQLDRAFYLLVTIVLFFVLVGIVKHYGAANLVVNDAIFHLFRGIRKATADGIMINITLLGQKQVILPVVAVTAAWLFVRKHFRTGIHVLLLGVLAAGSVHVLKSLIKSPRPWGILHSPENFGMPSGHATLSVAIYLGLALFIAGHLSKRWRWTSYACATLVILAVSISRLYLDAHWFTDVVSGWLLGAGILLAVIISYQRQKAPTVPSGELLFIAMATLTMTFLAYHHFAYNKLKEIYTPIDWPTISVSMDDWWHSNNGLPAYRTSLFGFPSQKINIEWVGSLDKIRETLQAEGWEKPPARDLISTLHRIADVESAQYLSLVSPQYLDKKPRLILSRRTNKLKNLLVLRLWNSNRVIKETGEPIWVGTIGIVPRSYSWIFKKHPGEVTISHTLVFPAKIKGQNWDTKAMWVYQPISRKNVIDQKIILIRPVK